MLAGASLVAVVGCGPSASEAGPSEAVVDHLAGEHGVDADRARARAQRTDAAASAFRDAGGTVDPARERQLRRSAMIRLWLEERFEPAHRPQDIPDGDVQRRLDDPQIAKRMFHPEIHLTCQVVLVPKSSEATSEPWRERTALLAAPLEQRLLRYREDLEKEENCELFNRIVASSNADRHDDIETKVEQFPVLADAGLDEGFVEAVTALDSPGLVEPFFTRFGRHIVFVPRILPAHLEEGSMPQAELDRRRADHLREEFAPAWRSERLAQALDDMRRDRVVRVAKGEGLGEPSL